jgi:hypothetical protein
MGGVTNILTDLFSSPEIQAQMAPEKQAYGGDTQEGYQAKAAKTARSGASGDTLLTEGGDLGNGTPDNAPDTVSDLGGATGSAASEKQAEAGKRRDEIATKLYSKS